MRRLFYIEDSIQNKISYYHLLFFLLSLPFDRFYSEVILISFLVHTVIHLQKIQFKNIGTDVFILQSVFFVTLAATGYAVSFAAATNTITKQLAIFLFPLLLSITSLDLVKYRSRLMMVFATGCVLTVLYLYYDAIHTILYKGLALKMLFSSAFVNHNFSLPIEIHATYLSMMLLISLVFVVKKLVSSPHKKYRKLLIFFSLILVAGLVQLSSKSILMAGLFIFNIIFPWHLTDRSLQRKFLLVTIPVSILLLVVIISVGAFRERYVVDLKNDLFKNNESETENWRRDRWVASVDLIKRSPVIGRGSGSEIPLLKELYYERKMYSSYLNSMNAHNQFLSFLINSGVIGLLVYLGTLCWGFWKAIKRKDLLLASFMLLILTVSFSEDLLDVNKGIFFYAFFFSFFILSKRKKQPDINAEAGNLW